MRFHAFVTGDYIGSVRAFDRVEAMRKLAGVVREDVLAQLSLQRIPAAPPIRAPLTVVRAS